MRTALGKSDIQLDIHKRPRSSRPLGSAKHYQDKDPECKPDNTSQFHSKRQNCVETSTCGSEVVAGWIAVDLAVESRHNLRMLGAPVKGAAISFGKNESVVTNASKHS